MMYTNKLALIDADIAYHRAAFSCESEFTFDDQKIRTAESADVADMFHRILSSTLSHLKTDRFILCWTSNTNFRHDVLSSYKKNRENVRRPQVDIEVKSCFQHRYPSILVSKLEADDIMGLLSGPDNVIVSDDKDLLTVPGLHYIPRKPELGVFDVSPEEAHYKWFKQILMGDRIDGYSGIPGIGDKKSDKILDTNGVSCLTIVDAYQKANLTENDALITARVSRILHPGEWDYTNNEPKLWTPTE